MIKLGIFQIGNRELVLDRRGIAFVSLVELFLALLLVWGLPTAYLRVTFSLLVVFIIPAGSLILLLIKGPIGFVKLLFFSIIVSPILSGAIVLILSAIFHPLDRMLFLSVISLLTLGPLLLCVFRSKKLVIAYNRAELISVALICISSLVILYLVLGIPHLPVPDESDYINSARFLLNEGQAFPTSLYFWSGDTMALLSSRIQWTSMISAFISAADISSAFAYCVSLVFLLGVSVASILLLPEGRRHGLLVVVVPLLIFSNVVLLMLGNYALNDLAFAFYSVASLVFFVNSFGSASGEVRLDHRNLFAAIALQIFVLLLKFNFIFAFPLLAILVIYVLRFKLYRMFWGKVVTVFVVFPALVYELFLDIPRNLALYAFNSDSLEFITRLFLPVSPVERVIVAFVSSSLSPKTIFDYQAFEILYRFYILFSPENLTLLVAAAAILLLFSFGRVLHDRRLKIMIAVSFLAILAQFLQAIQSGIVGDISRYYSSVIAPLTVVSAILYYGWVERKSYVAFLPLLGMLLLGFFNNYLTGLYNGVPVSWYAGFNYLTLGLLAFQAISYAVLIVPLFFLEKGKAPNFLIVKIRHFRPYATTFVFLSLTLVAIACNSYLLSQAYAHSPTFRDYGLPDTAKTTSSGITFSNSYALETYSVNYAFRETFISSMPPIEEFDNLIMEMPNGTKMVLFDSESLVFPSESSVGSYPRMMAGQQTILPSNATVWPTESVQSGNILRAYFLNNNYNVTVNGQVIAPIFTNVSWIQLSTNVVPYFNGSESFIEIPYSSELGQLTPPYTIETWVNYTPGPGIVSIILDSSTELGGYMLGITDGRISFSNGLHNEAHTTYLTVEPEVWSHIVVSYNGTHCVFWLNGENEVVKGPEFKPQVDEVPIWIGRSHWKGASKFNFTGIVGVINVYNHLVSSEDVRSNYLKSIKSSYFRLTSTMSYEEGDFSVYELASSRLLNSSSHSDIVVNRLSWSIKNLESSNPDIILTLSISSIREGTLTTVISNQLFSKVLSFQVTPGNNDVNLSFPAYIYNNGILTNFGSQISQKSNILVIDDQCTLLYEGTTGIFQFEDTSLIYYGLLVAVIAMILLVYAYFS